ncbi:hypothetical protein XELAEV_18004686mg [Xenopus laevis]|uniref:Receptor activity-modifying protein 3 n=1 Tax=Xenopus laevis TaxID=8355 RepID=A0A974BQT0_XENLA|nr:hypothetical protein XELAEV_18004686mg [Xenopus laevis]
MDKHILALLQLFFSLVCGVHQPRKQQCNETVMLENFPECQKGFEENMQRVDPNQWCNLTEFIMYYERFSKCTEGKALGNGCFWPNSLAEEFITGIHKHFFSNCTSNRVTWEDPPDAILTTLILIPVCLMTAMIFLVVWFSKRGDVFG